MQYNPIVDSVQFSENMNSFCGGSLYDACVLVVLHDMENSSMLRLVKMKLDNEYVNSNIIDASNASEWLDCNKDYDHIINVFCQGIQLDMIEDFYFLLQKEVLVLSQNEGIKSVCSILKNKHESEDIVGAEVAKSMIQGLGKLSTKYNIIENGILYSDGVPIEKVIEMAVFMSSKYGHVMSGEVIEMG